MFDLATAELLGEYVVREVKDIIGEKLKAAHAEIAELKAALAEMREDMHTYQALLNRPEVPGPPGPQGPPGKDGQDGKDGQSIIGPAGERGEKGIGEKGETGPQGLPGKDGHDGIGLASAFIDRGDNLVVTMTDGTVGTLGCVKGADGAPGPSGKDGKDGRDGKDGLSIDDLIEEVTDDGVLVHKWLRGGAVVKEARHQLHYMRWVGIWRAENKYEPQNVVTWDGSTWLAQCATSAKPGQGSKDWVLVTKRGRDGKDGESVIGPPGPAGRDGRDLTQMGPDGKKW